MQQQEIDAHVRHNVVVNVADGAFFGAATGIASFVTVIPLFMHTLTDSALLIGLVLAIRSVGWQLPQLLTARRVASLRRYKPMVLLMTINERMPFFGLGLIAWFAADLGRELALWLAYMLLIWQGLGGGLTATAWQTMIGKIMPQRWRGTFFGVQSAAANLLASIGAVGAGIILDKLPSPLDFALCFGISGIAMVISWSFLATTKEPSREPEYTHGSQRDFWASIVTILKRDRNFRWFLAARIISQLGLMATAFFTVYAVKRFGLDDQTAGIMTAIYLITQTIANPIMGWLGDRIGYRRVMEFGALLALAAGVGAWLAPALGWFYLIFALAGIANVALWTITMSMTLEFGSLAERPSYIGLANTLVAPATLVAPLIGGWLADSAGYTYTFAVAAAGGLLTWLILRFGVRDPQTAQSTNEPQLEQQVVVVS
ncbi:MFS transporter [Herpetosiphon llansteffanensis]|uniref:MFS transporter n=1 Tax=Herpetosiphon llansteffanensis TaxID=2094568 RepID=UPI0013DEF61B|nr:MFS transporter [Herpetosiphon llansteffanensis]